MTMPDATTNVLADLLDNDTDTERLSSKPAVNQLAAEAVTNVRL